MGYYDKDSVQLKELPQRSRVVIIGGGIHGVGVAHDLASRGWRDILLLEQNTLGSGTSTWSTKLIHGGLRYLQNPTLYPMVRESLAERKRLVHNAPDLVTPLPLIYPIRRTGGRSAMSVKAGLWLYDRLSGEQNLHRHQSLKRSELVGEMPGFNTELFSKAFVFWDGQTDDQKLVLRVASSTVKLGADIAEGVYVEKLCFNSEGVSLTLRKGQGDHSQERREISALYVVMATGPWSHELMKRSELVPHVQAVNNRGSHLIVNDLGLSKGLFLESPSDHRIFFALPWQGHTLIGTTEVLHDGGADDQRPSDEEVQYLLGRVNGYRSSPISFDDIRYVYSGLRWLPRSRHEENHSLSALSRESVLTVHEKEGPGKLWAIYGGKLTSYRALSETLGDKITEAFGVNIASQTHQQSSWSSPDEDIKESDAWSQRFVARG